MSGSVFEPDQIPRVVGDQSIVGEFFGRNVESIKIWRRNGMPGEPGVRNKDGRYDLMEIAQWLANKRRGSVEAEEERQENDQLERKRRIEADIKQIELDERRRNSIPSTELVPLLNGMAQIIRTAGENLEKHFGCDAAEILNEAIESYEKRVKQTFDV